MAMSTKFAGRAPTLLRHGRRLPAVLPRRTFVAATSRAPSQLLSSTSSSSTAFQQQKRNFTITARALNASVASQEAPNPKAYLESGVIKPKDIVDVKKVLVIGSGGLAIGQAGEFDYSGLSSHASERLCVYKWRSKPPNAATSRDVRCLVLRKLIP